MSERAECCDNCRFWDHIAQDSYDGDVPHSECRRYPPSLGDSRDVDENFTGRFPVTLACEWCGEFQPNESHPQGQSLDFLQLSLRARRAIRFTIPENRRFDSSGFRVISLEDLLSLTAKQLLERKNCGKKTIAEIREKLAAHGLHLKDDNVAATTPAS